MPGGGGIRVQGQTPKEKSLTRQSIGILSAAALIALALPVGQLFAQTQVPAAPDAAAQQGGDVSAPAPAGAPAFPAPDPANFTAASPTKETVNAFLNANWGYDSDRIWQVQAILKTQVDGVTKVVVFVGDKTGKQQPTVLQFFALADGKHIISGDSVVPFGDKPFADLRATMQQKADGPYRGSPSKDLELVEFADLQCPHCKEAQANMDKLAVDFPKARIVTQLDPLASIHPEAEHATQFAICANKMGASTAFFQFVSAVFDGQDGLATADGATLTLNSAATKAGLDPVKLAACAADKAVIDQVKANEALADSIGINEVPTLVVNGRSIPANIPYEVLKKIVEFQAKLDGITL